MKRIILDTNLWISFLITANYDQLDSLLFDKKCKLLFSQELLNEFITVARRPKLRNYFRADELSELIDLIEEFGEFIEVISRLDLCRDPKDNFLLSLGKDGAADFLITGDKDLLIIGNVDKMQICTISEFFKISETDQFD